MTIYYYYFYYCVWCWCDLSRSMWEECLLWFYHPHWIAYSWNGRDLCASTRRNKLWLLQYYLCMANSLLCPPVGQSVLNVEAHPIGDMHRCASCFIHVESRWLPKLERIEYTILMLRRCNCLVDSASWVSLSKRCYISYYCKHNIH